MREQYKSLEKDLGNRIQDLRTERGWSQKDLADRLAKEGFHLHQVGISKMERGTRPVRVAELAALATVLRVTIPELLTMSDAPERVVVARKALEESISEYAAALSQLALSSAPPVEHSQGEGHPDFDVTQG